MMNSQSQISIPVVGALPIELAVIELIQLLFLLLYKKYNKTSLSDTSLRVKIRTIGVNTGGDQAWFCVRVKCSNLAELEPCLEDVLPGFGPSVLTVIYTMQKIFPGEFIWTERTESNGSRHLVWHIANAKQQFKLRVEKKMRNSEVPVMEESSICLKVVQSKEHMVGECEKICNFLHRLKVFAPLCGIQFYINVWGIVSLSKFEWHSHRICIGQRRMVSDIEHFIPLDQEKYDVSRIFPKVGISSILTTPKSSNPPEDTIKLSTVAAIIPQPLSTEIGTRELNTKCRRLKVLFYGPACVPLILPTQQQSSLCPGTILKLDEFGLSIEGKLEESCPQDVVNVDWSYRLRPTGEEWSDSLLNWEDDAGSSTEPCYTILLIFFLERSKPLDNWHVEDDLLLIDNLRNRFVQLLCRHRTKTRKAVSQALNKLLQNLSKADQKQELVQKTISTMSVSLTEIIGRSRSESFKLRCMEQLEVQYSTELKSAIKTNLWDIASERYGVAPLTVKKRRTNNPKAKKRESTEKNVVHAKKSADGFDDLAEAVEMDPEEPTPGLRSPQLPLSPFSGLYQFLDEHSEKPLEASDFFQSLGNVAAPTLDKPQQQPSWDLLSNEELINKMDLTPFEQDKENNTNPEFTEYVDLLSLSSSASRSTTHKVKESSSRTHHVKDYFLTQATAADDWLQEFPGYN